MLSYSRILHPAEIFLPEISGAAREVSMHPLIGIVICGFTGSRQFVPNAYIQSVRYSGGIPLLIPLVRSDRMIGQYLNICDGFLFCGGADITPLLFGEPPRPCGGETDITVDLFQIRLMKQVLSAQKPVLGICRGMQVLSVACGGSLWQDLSLCPQKVYGHMQHTSDRSSVSHRIRTVPGTQMRRWIGPSIPVNSFHHQAVKEPGRSLSVSARSGDGIIEALEHTEHPFAVGVQWHPECMYRNSEEMRTLFHKLIKHASASPGSHPRPVRPLRSPGVP